MNQIRSTYTNQFYYRLINRFVARISEAYQFMLAKRQIARSQHSKFLLSINHCQTKKFDSKQLLLTSLIQAVYQECRLQIDLILNKQQNAQNQRIHSQESNHQGEQFQNQFYSLEVTNKKYIQNEWQINIKDNKKLNYFYTKIFPKQYEVLESADKYSLQYLYRIQEEQILYFQSRQQNKDRIFKQLLSQNQHIQQSLNWAQDIDLLSYNRKIETKLKKLKLIQLTTNQQLLNQSSSVRASQLSNKSINQNSPASPFKSINNQTKMPQIILKQRSISQNIPQSEFRFKNSIILSNNQREGLQQCTNQNQKQIYNGQDKEVLFAKLIEKVELGPKKQICSVLKSKQLIDLIPTHSSKLKPRVPTNLVQQIHSIAN
ncbi:unnamed protein product (macronuclear) [Paramecium tetraurelia]|uniref:Uncharacterized protein n=1 Tax=Paramecium tetraurelia TaxID=5888 RepID=A0DYS3_PARTE|nr:uncharacterized protein GSPATT00003158001 [Paramecium tetraurelia]CAK88190.1 unnamed protein product [Paramecium tetraurelia]|eukprot:XP_001455587.1 hypothetical protein (macronuclear) [Paramecium tetraurelia strain d4-2]